MTSLRRAGWLITAYLAAVAIATAVTLSLYLGFMSVAEGPSAMKAIGSYVLTGLGLTAVYGFPGWAATVALAGWFSERSRWFYGAAGGLNGAFAFALFSSFDVNAGTTGWFLIPLSLCCIGGLAGGDIHWRVAGREAGHWKSVP